MNTLHKVRQFLCRRFYLFQGPQLETSKAKGRRVKEGFFEKYCQGIGLDIGYGGDPVTSDCEVWDKEHGDAQYLNKIPNMYYDYVYSSHALEHVLDPVMAIKNWWRVLKNGGYLILFLPDRNLYEKRTQLPSRWNGDHKCFFLLDRDDPPSTIGIIPFIKRNFKGFVIVSAQRCDEGHTITDPEFHSDGEYSIEVVVRKLGQF